MQETAPTSGQLSNDIKENEDAYAHEAARPADVPNHHEQPLTQAELDAEEDRRRAEDDPANHPDHEFARRNEML